MKYNFEKVTTEGVNNGLVEGRSTSLNGHLGIFYDELIEVFGEPTWSTDSEAHRTRREWELVVELENGDNIGIDIYDYKENEKGFSVEEVEAWHVASERKSTDGVEKIDVVAILQQIVQDHGRLNNNDFPENPSFESIMSTGTYADQLQAIQILEGDSEIKEIGVTDNYGIAESNFAYYSTYSLGVSYEQRIMYLDDNSGVEEKFEVAQAENGVFEWNKLGNKMVNGYKQNEEIILINYPGFNGYNATIKNISPEGYPMGTMDVSVVGSDHPIPAIKSDRFVSMEEYQDTISEARFKIIQRIVLTEDQDELHVSKQYWDLVDSIRDFNNEGSTDFTPDVSDHFAPSEEAQDMADETGNVFHLTVPVVSTYSKLLSSEEDQMRNLGKDIYGLELYKDLAPNTTKAIQTFETEVVFKFSNKADYDKFVDNSSSKNLDFAFENYGSKHWKDMTREEIRSEMGTENWPYDISVTPSMNDDENSEFRVKFKSDGNYASDGIRSISKTLRDMKMVDVEIVETKTLPDDKEHTIIETYKNGSKKSTNDGRSKTLNMYIDQQ